MTPKSLVTTIAVLLMAASAFVIVSTITQTGTDKIVSQAIRFSLTCALCISMIRGWTPGRWITVVLMSLGILIAIAAGFALSAAGHSPLILFLLGGFYAICVIGLLTPLAGRHFAAQRE